MGWGGGRRGRGGRVGMAAPGKLEPQAHGQRGVGHGRVGRGQQTGDGMPGAYGQAFARMAPGRTGKPEQHGHSNGIEPQGRPLAGRHGVMAQGGLAGAGHAAGLVIAGGGGWVGAVFSVRGPPRRRVAAQTGVSNRGRQPDGHQFSATRAGAPTDQARRHRQFCACPPQWFQHGPAGGGEWGWQAAQVWAPWGLSSARFGRYGMNVWGMIRILMWFYTFHFFPCA